MATAKKVEEEVKEVVVAPEGPIKYMYEFNSWEEYNNYKGLKG